MLDVFKTLTSGILEKAKTFKGDWNENNSSSPNYIKNKPFYEEFEYVTYIPEQTVTFIGYRDNECYVNIKNIDMPWDCVPYRVTFDGVEYEGMMTDNVDNAWIDIYLDSGEHIQIFSFGYIEVDSVSLVGEHTIKVEQKISIIRTIESKYLGFPAFSGEGKNSICLNRTENIASGDCSHAEGYYTIASSDAQHVQGIYNIEDTENKYTHIVGNGKFEKARSNAHTLDWEGNAWYKGDVYVGGTSQDDANKLATEEYVDSNKPTKTSELTNDSGFITSIPDEYITETELTAKNYIDNTTLEGKGYLTEHQDLSSYALKTELHSHDNKTVLDTITDTKITEWDSKSTFTGSYNDLTDKPTIPSIEGLATEQYVNNMISFNDAGELVVTINGVSKTFVAKTE